MYRVIIVEDEPSIRMGLVEYVPWSELGFEITADFGSGESAIAFLREHRVDVVVTDVQMDNGTGLDVASFLSRERRLETVVFYSVHKDFEYARQGMYLGVRRYITKDKSFPELLGVFRDLKRELDAEFSGFQDDSGTLCHSDAVINQILRYITRHYQAATLESAAKVVQFNPSYLSTYIKQKTGENFRDILNRVRMTKALELLRDPTLRVCEVGDMVGYTDVRNFVRSFKKYYGKTPGKYKQKEWSQ